MDKKSRILYTICGILVIGIISATVFIVIGSRNRPVKVGGTELTYQMIPELLTGYCKISESDANEYINISSIKYAYLKLINNEVDVVVASDVSDEIIDWLNNNDTEVESTVVAKDALVFLNNVGNPIEDLTVGQVQGVFSGKYTNWFEVGGNDGDIITYFADSESEEEYMMKKFMDDRVLVRPKYRLKDTSFGALEDALTNYLDTREKAIGYTTYQNVENDVKDGIRIIKLSDVLPGKQTIKSGEYQATMNIYAIIRKDTPENSQTRRFVEYIISKDGQAIIEQCGYVNLVK